MTPGQHSVGTFVLHMSLYGKCCLFGRESLCILWLQLSPPKLRVGKLKKILKNSEIVFRPHQSTRRDFRYISYPKKISMTTWHLGSTLWALLCCPGHFTENVVCSVGNLCVFFDSKDTIFRKVTCATQKYPQSAADVSCGDADFFG